MIKTVVFPIAGLGTRFLPATKAVPKEFLPVVDRPLIQYAIDEARAAGFDRFIFVTGEHNRDYLQSYLTQNPLLEEVLKRGGKSVELELVEAVTMDAEHYDITVQTEPKGLGHAVWCAREYIGDAPFAVMLPDDLMMGNPGTLTELADVYAARGGNVVAVEEVPQEMTSKYGVLDVEEMSEDGYIISASGMVEKPAPEAAPSNLTVIGRYILDPRILEFLDRGMHGAGGEIQLTDAIAHVIGDVPLTGVRTKARRYDCGSKVGFVEATLAFAMHRSDLKANLSNWLGDRIGA